MTSSKPSSEPEALSGRAFAESNPLDKAGDGLWQHYLSTVEAEDEADFERWNGSTTGILTFTGLFAATVAAFVIESYQSLSPDSGAQTAALLYQLVNSSGTSPSVPFSDISTGPFQVPITAIVVNVLWFISLVISLGCALLSTLIQEWSRSYLRDVKRRSLEQTVKDAAFNHIYIRMGIDRYKLDYAASIAVLLVHLAVALFLVGLVIFLFPINTIVASVVAATACATILIYIAPSLIPFLDKSCPYRTPLTDAFSAVSWVLSFFGRRNPVEHFVLPKWTNSRREIPETEKKCFLNQDRMKFVWARAAAYLLQPEGFGTLSNYVTVLAEPGNTAFARYLVKGGFADRALRQHIERFRTMELTDVLGALRLSSFVVEICGVDDRWRTASWHLSVPFAMRRLRELLSPGILTIDEMQCFDMIVALARLRKAVAEHVLPSEMPAVQRSSFVAYVNSVETFQLIPVYAGQDPTTHLAEANLLSLVAHTLTIPLETLKREGANMHALLERELRLQNRLRDWSPSGDERPPASSEFVRVLGVLGLTTWMQPGSPLVIHNTQRPYEILLLGELSWVADVLRELTRRVTFDGSTAPAFPIPSVPESEPPTAFEGYGYSAIWRPSQAASEGVNSPTSTLVEGARAFAAFPKPLVVHTDDIRNSKVPVLVRSDAVVRPAASELSPDEGRSDQT